LDNPQVGSVVHKNGRLHSIIQGGITMNKANQIYEMLKNEELASAIGILEAVKFNLLMDTWKKTMEEIENER